MSFDDRPLLGVVGAGTMGAGIAEVAAAHGFPVCVQDVATDVLDRSRRRLEESLQQRAARGRLDARMAREIGERIRWVAGLQDLRDAAVVIEAVPEDLALKRDVFRRLDELCATARVLASNTSSLSISAIGAATRRPERVVGMHFFNPVPVMALVEVVRGARTADETVAATAALARALGKTPVEVADAPGFLVNRVARPFSTEAVRVLAEGAASVETIDRIMREAGAYRMGPFELLDLIGLDVNLAVSRAIYEAFFHDPRYRPHPWQQRMVDAGLLGRKSGRGFYDHTVPQTPRPAAAPPGGQLLAVARSGAREPAPVVVVGDGPLADGLGALLREAGLGAVTQPPGGGEWPAAMAVDAGVQPAEEKARVVADLDAHLSPAALVLTLTLTASTTAAARLARHPERIVGFATLPPLADRRLIEVQAGLRTRRPAVDRALAFWAEVGRHAVEVADGVAGVFPRIQAMLSHEALVAWTEGIAGPADIDTAMRLGLNYPQGPVERADAMGLDLLLAILEALLDEHADPRYRPLPLLRRAVAAGAVRVRDLPAPRRATEGGGRDA